MTRRLLLHCLDGLGIGGAEGQLALLLRHLPAGMFDHVVCHLGPRRDLVSAYEALGIPVVDLSAEERRPVRAVLRLTRAIREMRPAMIHADHDYAKLCARIAGGLTGTPVLATVGNTAPAGGRRFRSASARRRLRLLEGAARLIGGAGPARYMAISGAVRDDLVARGVPSDRITVVSRGLELEAFAPDPPEALAELRRSLGLEGPGPVLMHVGRLAPQKRQDVLIRALPAIARLHPGLRLLLAGDGPRREAYRALAEAEGVADRVHFLGLRRDTKALLQLADLFLFPSDREGTGVALLEAMALSRACVASRIPALEEVLGGGQAGVLVPPGRPDLLAEAVLELLADPARRAALGRQARAVIETRYDIRRSAAGFAQTCVQVIEARRARGTTAAEAEAR